jgi:geranylgeranyl reductase
MNNRTLRTSALVVGGGPAGSTAARFLAEAGIDTILVERDLTYVKPCGGGIPSGGFKEFDLPESLIRKKIYKVVIISPADRRTEIDLVGGHICITERGHFDSALRNIARDKGAEIIEGEFRGFTARNGAYTSFIYRKDKDAILKIDSDYVLASDGISFSVGRLCAIRRPHNLYTISARLDKYNGDACEFWFGNSHASNFYSWVFPSDGHASVGTGGNKPRELRALFTNFISRKFKCSMEYMAKQQRLCKPIVFPLPAWRGGPYSTGNLLLLGDAAGMVMPTTYEGIYYAMKSAQFAAAAIIERKPANYRRLIEDRFKYRFLTMNIFRQLFFRSDKTIEKWIRIHGSNLVQEIAMKLWLQKDSSAHNLYAYLRAFGSRVMS